MPRTARYREWLLERREREGVGYNWDIEVLVRHR